MKQIAIDKFKSLGIVLLFTLPAMIPLFVFWIYPIIRSLWLSFTNWNFMTPDYDVIFWENYRDLFSDSRFYEALKHTLLFTVGTVLPTLMGGLLLALLLQKPFKGNSFFKFVLFSPWVTPTVAISIVWTWIFQPKD